MKIYYPPDLSTKELDSLLKDPDCSAYARIRAGMSRAYRAIEVLTAQQTPKKAQSAIEKKALTHCLVKLGIHSTDHCAQQKLASTLNKIKHASVITVLPHPTSSGTYFIKNQNSVNVGVFKLGEKRAAHELAVRKLAYLLNLAPYATPGIFCTLEEPLFTQDEQESAEDSSSDTVKELWNGSLAYYTSEDKNTSTRFDSPSKFEETTLKTAKTVIGILQPFITPPEYSERSPTQNAHLLLLILAASIRDVKTDGIIGSTLIDSEECFVRRNLPANLELRPAITDLHYLKDIDLKQLQEPLPKEVIKDLKTLVETWDIKAIVRSMKNERVLFFDKKAEEAGLQKDRGDSRLLTDEGGNEVLISTEDYDTLDPVRDHLDPTSNPESKLLQADQLAALSERLHNLKSFILGSDSFSLEDLVFTIDPWAQTYSKWIEVEQLMASSRDLALQSKWEIIGRRGPRVPKNIAMELHQNLCNFIAARKKAIPPLRYQNLSCVEPNVLDGEEGIDTDPPSTCNSFRFTPVDSDSGQIPSGNQSFSSGM